jgi:hypothetical protein
MEMEKIVDVEIEIVGILEELKKIEPDMLMDEAIFNKCKDKVQKLNNLFMEHEELAEEYKG